MLFFLIAAAAQAVEPPSLAAAQATAVEDKKVCQLEEDVSSRIRYRKICLKQSEWDAIAKETQKDLEGSRNDRGVAPNP